MTDEERESAMKRDALALAVLIYDIYVEQAHDEDGTES